MITVTVNASKTYDIRIGKELLPTIGKEATALGKAKTVCIVSDSNVAPIYGKTVETSLLNAGFTVLVSRTAHQEHKAHYKNKHANQHYQRKHEP